MGIYSRKRKKSGFRVFILSIFVLSIFLVLGYYYFYPNNLKTVLDENILDKVVEKLRHYRDKTGDDFWTPSPYLVDLAENGKQF